MYGFRSSVLSGVHRSLVAAENALARQSAHHPDGWGIAYYNDRFPHLIRSDKQALEDRLFRELSAIVATRTLIAHVRQATTGSVNILNCHPFQHGPWTFAHNGQIGGFDQEDIRARVRDAVDPRFRAHILGSTDSETCFYIFLSQLARRVDDIYHGGVDAQAVVDALQEAMEVMFERGSEADPKEPSRLTFLLTNGHVMVGVRFRRALHYSTYKTHCPESGACHAYEPQRCEREVNNGVVKHLILSSETIADGPNVWLPLQDGEYVAVDHGMFFGRGVMAGFSNRSVVKLPVVA